MTADHSPELAGGDDQAAAAGVRCDPLAGYPGAYRVRTADAEPYGDQEPIITQVAEGWAVMWGRTPHGLFEHHSVLPGSADLDRAARAAVDLVAAVAAGKARSAPDLIAAMDAGCPVCGAPTGGAPCEDRPAGSPGTDSCADLAAAAREGR